MILISAGFDAHREDLLGGLALVEEDYEWMTRELTSLAGGHAQGRIASMLEGGYNLKARWDGARRPTCGVRPGANPYAAELVLIWTAR